MNNIHSKTNKQLNSINVVQLNSGLGDSTAPYRLHQALIEQGICSHFIAKWDVRKNAIPAILEDTAHELEYFESKRFKKFSHIYFVFEDVIQEKLDKFRLSGYTIPFWGVFFTGRRGFPVHNINLIKNADIIHLNWVAGFLSDKEIKRLGKNGKPLVWTMHDCGNLTGGSHICYECERFKSECGLCPCLTSSKEKDLSRKIAERRRKLFSKLNITLVAPSNWMKNQLASSTIWSGHKCVVIPNALDTDIFAPHNEVAISDELAKSGKIKVLFGALSLDIPHKGYKYLLESIELLKKQRPDIYNRIEINTIGGNGVEKNFDLVSHNWGYIDSPEELSKIYSSMDILLYPTLSDNLPGVVMESLSCETPVVSFDVGGVSDLIEHKTNGYLAQYKNTQDFVNGIIWVVENNPDNILGKNGRITVLKNYKKNDIAQKYIELYHDIKTKSTNVE